MQNPTVLAENCQISHSVYPPIRLMRSPVIEELRGSPRLYNHPLQGRRGYNQKLVSLASFRDTLHPSPHSRPLPTPTPGFNHRVPDSSFQDGRGEGWEGLESLVTMVVSFPIFKTLLRKMRRGDREKGDGFYSNSYHRNNTSPGFAQPYSCRFFRKSKATKLSTTRWDKSNGFSPSVNDVRPRKSAKILHFCASVN